ncbi:aromatic amino acid transport family protein [uncultured Pseudodesulfovibrio sp.]|uniref:aromatic amino acid transport family protein n=1 Tax=uncultured Pseudodesulfovibrio sp. TaxID=2035858 RepID=UPI0029C73A9E|nr:aromatic amino acid transport family protein [uncultured Pseudodesulfovibrio sp.]
MSTAYIATAIALISFIRDLVSGRKVNKWFVAAVAFMPPLLVSIFYPDVFLEALNIVGGSRRRNAVRNFARSASCQAGWGWFIDQMDRIRNCRLFSLSS